jgi:ABC-2 type transport system permease protein
MMADIRTVMWKEFKGLFYHRGSRRRALLTMFLPILMVAVLVPWQIGIRWLDTPWSFLASFLVPVMLAGMAVPESFAGEKERHTLSTLLSSRLPDRAILFGKMAVAIGYAWVTTLIVLLVGLVTVNAAHWQGEILLYTPMVALGNVAFSLLLSVLVSGLGVLISLRSSTVQGAAQALMFSFFIPLNILGFVPLLLLRAMPGGRQRLQEILDAADFTQIVLIVIGVLVAISAGLLWAVTGRFRRARLMLD